ncbi:hypothetical protein F0L17_13720 [Streptomyces sp. TRM43335]|uniref:Uncharacterized protein n=1 Tax=Streptomyces taklimakanensis TaxID=2569853 RepID=A0A6G2BDJ3_9ACTN|nr:hypothetical protein [Streptomyces taklimakanensis]MTE20149.1 hypothetical protein [Streptomyces taklimakanensis]
MLKQRLVAAGIAAVALMGSVGTAAAAQGQDQGSKSTVVTVGQGGNGGAASEESASSGVRVVRPYEPVEIGQGALMGLLPEGRQNYVVAWSPESFAASVEASKQYVGDDIRPNSLSGGISHSPERGTLITGAWRTDVDPARITVHTVDGTYDAGMLRLPGDPGWGTYHLDTGHSNAMDGPVTVIAHAPDGTVIDDLVMDFHTW